MTDPVATNERKRRGWRVIEGVAILVGVGILATAASVWRASGQHDQRLSNHETRIDTLEAPGFLIQLAQASDRLEKLEEGAEIVAENQSAIAAIQATQSAQGEQLRRIEGSLERQTGLIIRALSSGNPGHLPDSTPVPAPEPPEPIVTTEPNP